VFLLGAWGLQIWKASVSAVRTSGRWASTSSTSSSGSVSRTGQLISAVAVPVPLKYPPRARLQPRAEAMTVIAVMCAGMYPADPPRPRLVTSSGCCRIRTAPPVDELQVAARVDVFAVSTYLTIFGGVLLRGSHSDFRHLKRYTRGFSRHVYSALSLGWVGTKRQWRNIKHALRAASRAWRRRLVLSVHSVVAWDFAMGLVGSAGTPPSSRRTSWPAPSSPAARWCSPCAFRCASCRSSTTSCHRSLREAGQGHALTSMIVDTRYIVEFILAYYSGNVYEFGIVKDRAPGSTVSLLGMVFSHDRAPAAVP